MLKTKVGTDITIRYSNNIKIFGKIIQYLNKSSSLNGVYSIVFISTPHGSIIKTDASNLFKPSKKELSKLRKYEKDAKEQGK